MDGEYRTIELTTEPDGILKGYSEVLGLSLAWDDGWPRFYDPATGAYLQNWRQDREALRTTQPCTPNARRGQPTRNAYDNWKGNCAACVRTHRRPQRRDAG